MAQSQGLIQAEAIRVGRPQLPPTLAIQEVGGVRKTIQRGIEELLASPAPRSEAKRTRSLSPVSWSEPTAAAATAIAVSPRTALGEAGDMFVRHGAGWVLAETTETYGQNTCSRAAPSPAK
jgi:altronate hydrolase